MPKEGDIMLRNMIFCLIGGLLLASCASPGYSANPEGDVRIKNTYPPGGIQSRDEKTGIGVDVKDEETYRGSKTTITPFIGENPYHNKGWRLEKKRMKELRKRDERQLAVELAREDAAKGDIRNYEDVPGKFVWVYNEEFDRYRRSLERRDRRQYERDEYQRGRDEFREENPEYGRAVNMIDQVRQKAKLDFREGVYDSQSLESNLLREYDKAYVTEIEHQAKMDALKAVYNPPYWLSERFLREYKEAHGRQLKSRHFQGKFF